MEKFVVIGTGFIGKYMGKGMRKCLVPRIYRDTHSALKPTIPALKKKRRSLVLR